MFTKQDAGKDSQENVEHYTGGSSPRTAKSLRVSRSLLLTAGFAVALAVTASCAAPAESTVVVSSAEVSSGKFVKHIEFSGVLAPNQTATVFSRLSGQAREVDADIGSQVKADQVLVVIDTKELNAQLAVSEAAESTIRDQAGQAKIGIATAQTNFDQAQKNYDRIKSLFDTKAVSQSQMDDADAKLELSKRALENATTQYQLLSNSSLAQADAQANLIRVQISNAIIRSPIPGVVTNRNINMGEIASPAAPLMTVADTAMLRLQGNVSQDAVPLISQGQEVVVTIDGIGDQQFKGAVTQIGPVAASTGQYFPIVVSIKNNGKLLAGMTAVARFEVSGQEAGVIPHNAILNSEGQTFVFVLKDGVAEKREIRIGLQDASSAQILEGLKTGEIVATTGVDALKDGQKVKVRE